MNLPFTQPLRQRLAYLRWSLPLAIGLLAVLYELGPGRWIHDVYGEAGYFSIDIVFYATIAPLLTFWVLTRIGHWLDEKEHAAQQARASEQRLASVTAASADAILGLDPAGRIESWNRGAELIFGYAPDQIVGRPLSALLAPGEAAEVELNWLLAGARQAGFIRGHELAGRAAGGQPLALE
ncbi:MAG: PAS domain S-box protein, partial [Anaerolineales bacterium]